MEVGLRGFIVGSWFSLCSVGPFPASPRGRGSGAVPAGILPFQTTVLRLATTRPTTKGVTVDKTLFTTVLYNTQYHHEHDDRPEPDKRSLQQLWTKASYLPNEWNDYSSQAMYKVSIGHVS
jgi:hypothetical protein